MDWDLAVALAAVVVPTLAVGGSAWLAHRARLADRAENRDAHAGITARIDAVDQRAQDRDDRLVTEIHLVDAHAQERADAHRTALEAIA